MNLKAIIIALTLTLSCLTLAAENAVRVTADQQQPVTLLLNQRPLMTFQDDEMLLTTNDVQLRFPLNDHPVVHFIDTESDGLETIENPSPRISISRELIALSGLPSDTKVALYTLDGKLVAAATSDAQGNANLSFSGSQPLIIRTGNVSFKILPIQQ